jgi:hypothetical protein
MSKFRKFQRFDSSIAEQGVWFVVRDELGNEYGEFLCSLIDSHAQHTNVRAQRAAKVRPDAAANKPGDAAKQIAELLVTMSLNHWKGVFYADGTEVEFTPETAIEYLTEETFVATKLLEYAQNVANYQPQSAETVAKN